MKQVMTSLGKTAKLHGCIGIFRLSKFIQTRGRGRTARNARMSWGARRHFVILWMLCSRGRKRVWVGVSFCKLLGISDLIKTHLAPVFLLENIMTRLMLIWKMQLLPVVKGLPIALLLPQTDQNRR